MFWPVWIVLKETKKSKISCILETLISWPMWIEATIHLFFFISFVLNLKKIVLSRCRWIAVEVQNSQHSTTTARYLPLVTPTLSTVVWSKTVCFTNLWGESRHTFFWKFIHHRPILGKRHLTRSLHNTQKLMFHDGTVAGGGFCKGEEEEKMSNFTHRICELGSNQFVTPDICVI